MSTANTNQRFRLLPLGLGLLVSACTGGSESPEASRKKQVERPSAKVVVVSRKEALSYYPCQKCHQHIRDEGGVTSPHSEVRVKHMEGGDNCQVCHSDEKPEDLQLATGKILDLDDAPILCGQCHSTQYKDWSNGIHGKQTGNWLKELHRATCTSCHNPHQPEFGTMTAEPPPPFPRFGIPKGKH